MPSPTSPPKPITVPSLNIITSSASPESSSTKRRGRSGSIVAVQEVAGDQQDLLDQSAFGNINADWVNSKGAWLIHPVLIFTGKIMIDSIPGMHQNTSWTIVNLSYMTLSYLMFHYVTGIPFGADSHGGAYDDLTLWEQIDEGAQYTPAKKWLFCTPIALFLISTHYTHYDPWAFAINFTALIVVLIPKLPQFHRQRLRFVEPETPGAVTPKTPLGASGRTTPTPSNY
ncbi:Orm1 type endoplasmic reticulum protein [Cantharellus anzutake]|uniref:Orm1 type endoplasmic reticulum protein n=1 Tax=Cantharellus anzutake TaxID=1750568 RepID=UPI0019060BBA|nr:Orm1 type endoplasmic reticulum protein [Cantharellus anzutake]KAF8338736.1 Orm1 type endoplasmic reticulum protein [Cantharellus anzutake]